MAYTTTASGILIEHRTFQATLFCEGTGGEWQEIQFQRERNYFSEGKLLDRCYDPSPIIVTPQILANNPQGAAMVVAMQNLVDAIDRARRS